MIEPFGDNQELADELIALVVHGHKRATAAALADYEIDKASPPRPGQLSVATDGRGKARAVLRTTDVRVGPLSSVDDAFAWDEGEGDRTRASWIEDHENFFLRYLPTIGVEFDSTWPPCSNGSRSFTASETDVPRPETGRSMPVSSGHPLDRSFGRQILVCRALTASPRMRPWRNPSSIARR